VYSGPIGAVLTPELKGLENYPDLPHASSLCGACFDACPVKIDIPAHLVRLRRKLMEERIEDPRVRVAMRLWAKLLMRPRMYRASLRLARLLGGSGGWRTDLPGPLAGWTDHRDFPPPARRGFREWWDKLDREGADDGR
jgi:L-lactate dehydrogenase complex protein LldF